jgi:integrase
MARLLYGSGLRLSECCRLRVRDVQLPRLQIVVRGGKGAKDRVVMLPRSASDDLEKQMEWRKKLHERDVARGVARVELPFALERKYPRAARELGWQFVFASRNLSNCPRTGRLGRHHLLPGSLQRAVGQAGRSADLARAIHCHTFRHSLAARRGPVGSPTEAVPAGPRHRRRGTVPWFGRATFMREVIVGSGIAGLSLALPCAASESLRTSGPPG